MTVNRTVEDAIEAAAVKVDIWEKVHAELESGRDWAEINNGFREGEKDMSYDDWYHYMQASLRNSVTDIVYTYRYWERQKKDTR